MKTLGLMFLIAVSPLVFGVSKDFGRSNEYLPPLTPEVLRTRLEVSGEIFLFDESGKRLLGQAREERRWRIRGDKKTIESYWGSESNLHAPLNLHHVWTVQEDGTIKVLIEQYERFDKTEGKGNAPTAKNLIKKEEIVISDFAPVIWQSSNEKKKRLVVRLTPRLLEEKTPLDFKEFPISATDMLIKDSEGKVWTEHVTLTGKYTGIITHQGALFLSFYPFPDGREMGMAEGKTIQVNLDNRRGVTLLSETAFLPEGMQAKVYALYQPQRRTPRLTSTLVKASDKEAEFLEAIQNAR